MSESFDLTNLLESWPYEPGRLNVRWVDAIDAVDGERRVQVRLDLGVLQMNADGRPDGRRPDDCDSVLAREQERLRRYTQESETSTGFVLGEEECRALREEAVQFYHRYVALFALGDHTRVLRDTERNLEAFDLCRDYGAGDVDRALLEQFRPHVLMMRARATAELAVADEDPKRALAALDRGLEDIRSFLREHGREDAFEHSNEAQLLRGMRDTLIPKLPASQRVELEERLRAAIDAENYELAAILRDELRLL